MTSNSLPIPYVASDESHINAWQIAYCCFDGDDDTVWGSDYPIPAWIKIDLGSAATACAYGMKTAYQNYPVDWTFEGSVNGVTGWTVLDTKTGQSAQPTLSHIDIGNEDAYRYYRWDCTVTSHTNIAISILEIYIAEYEFVRDIIQGGHIPIKR